MHSFPYKTFEEMKKEALAKIQSIHDSLTPEQKHEIEERIRQSKEGLDDLRKNMQMPDCPCCRRY